MSPTIVIRFGLVCFICTMALLLRVSAGSNAASVTACADLAPQLALSVNSPQANQPFTIQIAVENKGDAAAGRFRAYLYVDPTQQPPTAATGDTTSFGTFGLAVQEQLTYEYDYTFTVTGTHVIYLWVDRDNQVSSECNEANNLVSRTVLVGVDPGCQPDTYEANNNDNQCATAPRLTTAGVVQRHNLCTTGDEDWVSFEGLAGVEYTIVAGNVEADADITLDLLDHCDGTPLGTQDPTLGRGARLQQPITQSGLYYVQVKHHDAAYGPQSGYDLSITASCTIDEHEPDSQCLVAHELEANGRSQRHSFCGTHDEDWLLLQATAGVTYQISTQQWEQKSQPILTLYETCSGTTVAQSNARGQLTWSAPTTNGYRLRVTNADPAVEGLATGYDLLVTTSTPSADGFEPNESATAAKVITTDGAATQHAFSVPGDQDWLAFEAVRDQYYRLETLDLAAATDTYLCLYGPDAITRLACDDDSGAGLGSKLWWQAPTSGRYYLHLRHYSPEAGGDSATYRFAAQRAAVCDPDAYEPDNLYGVASELTLDAPPQPHTICSGSDVDWGRFWVQTPGVYELRADTQGADADPQLTLYDVDGQTALFSNDDYAPGLSARILWPFARAGVYYVRAQAFDGHANGNGTDYLLRVSRSQEIPTPLPTTPPPPTPTFTSSPTPTPSPTPTAPPESTPTPTGVRKALIVTNQQRLTGFFGTDRATALAQKLQALADQPSVAGVILRVEENHGVQTAYTAWDQEPGSLSKANAVANAIRSLIWQEFARYPQMEFLVLVGDDRVIPYYRGKDGAEGELSTIRERDYAQNNVAPNTTIGLALRQDVTLFDDFYASRQALQVRGQALYLPDKASGRLVETPEEINQTIDRFLQNNALNRSDTLILSNNTIAGRLAGGQYACTTMQQVLGNQADCKTSTAAWSQTDFTQWHLQPNPAPALHLLVIGSRHWQMNMGDNTWLARDDIAGTANTLAGKIVIATGSHGGLNVTDGDLHPQDWPQFYTQRGAVYIGNTGWELFFTEQAVGLSHKLAADFARQLLASSTIGEALRTAKQHYWQAAGAPSLLDRKVLHEMHLYNLPMLRLPLPLSGPNEFPSVRLGQVTAAVAGEVTAGTVVTATLPIALASSFASLMPVTTSGGNYYTLDGHVNWKPKDAGQPLYFFDLDTSPVGELGAARGVLWLGSVYTDVLNPNLFIPQVTGADAALVGHGQGGSDTDAPLPANPLPIQLDPTGKRLLIEWGHYDVTANRQRLYGDATLELTFSTSADTLAPTVQHSAAQVTSTGIAIKLEASDASGIKRAVATYTDGAGLFQSIDLTYRPDMDKWVGIIPGVRNAAWFAQVVDGAGNVAYVLDKGRFFQASAPTAPMNYLYLPTVAR